MSLEKVCDYFDQNIETAVNPTWDFGDSGSSQTESAKSYDDVGEPEPYSSSPPRDE